jgi:IS66 C-terminal element
MYSLIVTAKMNDVDPQAGLADILGCLPDLPLSRLPEILTRNLKPNTQLGPPDPAIEQGLRRQDR